MLSSPANPTLSSRAAGKARAIDVGIRARLASTQTVLSGVRTPTPAQYTPAQRMMMLQSDTRPNEIREAINAQQMASLTKPVPKPQVRGRPTQADLQHGNMYVNWVRKGILSRVPYMHLKEVSEEQKAEYDATFDVLWSYVFEMEPLLPVYACWMAEDTIRQLIIATTVVKHQKASMSSPNPRYILDLPSTCMMIREVQGMREAIASAQKGLYRPPHGTDTDSDMGV